MKMNLFLLILGADFKQFSGHAGSAPPPVPLRDPLEQQGRFHPPRPRRREAPQHHRLLQGGGD